jgi:hypothetical protein
MQQLINGTFRLPSFDQKQTDGRLIWNHQSGRRKKKQSEGSDRDDWCSKDQSLWRNVHTNTFNLFRNNSTAMLQSATTKLPFHTQSSSIKVK